MASVALALVVQASVLGVAGEDYSEAAKRASETGRPLVVLVGADWCPACVVMRKTVLPEVAKSGVLEQVEFAYVDLERQPDVARKLLRENSIPQLIRFEKTPSGWKSNRLLGAQDADEVSAFVDGRPRGGPIRLTGWLEKISGRGGN